MNNGRENIGYSEIVWPFSVLAKMIEQWAIDNQASISFMSDTIEKQNACKTVPSPQMAWSISQQSSVITPNLKTKRTYFHKN